MATLQDKFKATSKEAEEGNLANASPVCKEYYTPADRWVVVSDSKTDSGFSLLGILKPNPQDPSVLEDALVQISEVAENLGGSVEIYGEPYNIGPISGDPGARQIILVRHTDVSATVNALSDTQWKNNPYSNNPHTIIEDILNKKRLNISALRTPKEESHENRPGL